MPAAFRNRVNGKYEKLSRFTVHTSINTGDEGIRYSPGPFNPLISKLLFQHRVLPRRSQAQTQYDRRCDENPVSHEQLSEPHVKEPGLCHPGARCLAAHRADDGQDHPGVARVAHNRVRTVGDEPMALLNAELKCEEAAQCLIALESNEGA